MCSRDLGWTGFSERMSHFFHSDCTMSLSLWDLHTNLDGHLEPQEWNPRNGTPENAKGLQCRVAWAKLPCSFALAWSRGLARCKWISESIIAKDLEMAPSLWVVWSAGAAFPATAEVTQPEPWWSLQMSAWPGLTPAPGSQ